MSQTRSPSWPGGASPGPSSPTFWSSQRSSWGPSPPWPHHHRPAQPVAPQRSCSAEPHEWICGCSCLAPTCGLWSRAPRHGQPPVAAQPHGSPLPTCSAPDQNSSPTFPDSTQSNLPPKGGARTTAEPEHTRAVPQRNMGAPHGTTSASRRGGPSPAEQSIPPTPGALPFWAPRASLLRVMMCRSYAALPSKPREELSLLLFAQFQPQPHSLPLRSLHRCLLCPSLPPRHTSPRTVPTGQSESGAPCQLSRGHLAGSWSWEASGERRLRRLQSLGRLAQWWLPARKGKEQLPWDPCPPLAGSGGMLRPQSWCPSGA